ncbi:MAG: molybdopterin-dependent oxidoreductase, partial [Arenicellales bacterium]
MTQIKFQLNGETVLANGEESLLAICKRLDIEVPNLCYHPQQRVDANCRSCMVEIEGERTLAPACRRKPSEGMVVHTRSSRAVSAQRGVLNMLSETVSESKYTTENKLRDWQEKLNPNSISDSNTPGESIKVSFKAHQDTSHPAIDFHADACILCARCVRACREVQVNNIIGITARGNKAQVVFDLNDPLGDSRCVGCGECVQACPTGALSNKGATDLIKIDKKVDSVCPYCGVGCLLTYHVKENKIVKVSGRDGPANHDRLCVKGRYGFDYIHHPERLTMPLIRRDDIAKGLNEHFDPSNPLKMFRQASWEEALSFAAEGLRELRDDEGAQSLAGFGSAKGSNEEAYLFQKLVRVGFGNNNIDHCTRLCHASSVAALLEGIGSGAVSNQVEDIKHSDVIFIIGSNTTSNHPVAATFIKQAKRAGKTLIVIDPRRTDIAEHADYFLQFKPDSDVALLNALLHVVIDEDLIDEEFIQSRTEDYERIKQNVAELSPEKMSKICGVSAENIRAVARIYAQAKNAIIFWGMGASQHIHGTDNVRCLISLCLLCGQ